MKMRETLKVFPNYNISHSLKHAVLGGILNLTPEVLAAIRLQGKSKIIVCECERRINAKITTTGKLYKLGNPCAKCIKHLDKLGAE